MILDEATSALDLITEKEIQAKIDQYRSGRTTIIIAHRLSTIKNADYIFVLDKGTVVEEGEHEFMAMKNIYYQLVNSEEEYVI